MKYDNSTVIQAIKQNYYKEIGRKRNVSLPSQISFITSENNIKIFIPKKSVISNMQDDRNAFEGWAVIVKRWGDFLNIELEWDKPEDINNGHYQRFLFRVKEFNNSYDWFSISPHNADFEKELLIKGQSIYYCNQPSNSRNNRDIAHGNEAILEHKFIEDKLNKELTQIVNASFINRQLPVGLFKNKVSNDTAIFTKGKSAIDLWGVDNENNLLIFELKAGNNKKVGIISELFFYVSFMKNVQKGIFKYENDSLNNIVKTKKIRAFFLSAELHPLIDKKVLEILNKSSNMNISYGSISILKDDKLCPTFTTIKLKNNKYQNIEKIINNILSFTPLNSNSHSIIKGLLNDEITTIKQAQNELVKSEFLDIIIEYIKEILEDDYLSTEEIVNVTQLKQLFRIKEGDFYRIKPDIIKEIIINQIQKMFSDDKIDKKESLQKVELQGLFDLSYDQFMEIYNSEAKKLIAKGVNPKDLDTFIS